MVTKLVPKASYSVFKAWKSSVCDWVVSCATVKPEALGPQAVRSVARITIAPLLYTDLEEAGGLGKRDGVDITWESMLKQLVEILHLSPTYLYVSLWHLN